MNQYYYSSPFSRGGNWGSERESNFLGPSVRTPHFPLPHPRGNHQSVLVLHGFVCSWTLHVKGSHDTWHLVSGFFHSASCFQGSSKLKHVSSCFLFKAELYAPRGYPCICWWRWAAFAVWLLWMVLLWAFEYKFLPGMFSVLLGLHLRGELLGCRVTVCVTFWGTTRQHFTIPPATWEVPISLAESYFPFLFLKLLP